MTPDICPECGEWEAVRHPGHDDLEDGDFWCRYCGHVYWGVSA